MWKKKLSNIYFSFQNIKETNNTFASAKSSSHLKKKTNCTKINQNSQDKKTEYYGNFLIMRDLYIVCVRICNQYSYIHRTTIVKRSVYWGGERLKGGI